MDKLLVPTCVCVCPCARASIWKTPFSLTANHKQFMLSQIDADKETIKNNGCQQEEIHKLFL